MLLRELAGGDPPYRCKLIFRDDPAGFGHRVMESDRLVLFVLTRMAEFEAAVAEKLAEGFAETERSLTRRVFATDTKFWIVMLDGNTVLSQTGGIRADWQETSGQVKEKLFRDRDRAMAAYQNAIEDRHAQGYCEKYGRKLLIPAAPTTPPQNRRKKGAR